MNVKQVCLGSLAAALLGLGVARGQEAPERLGFPTPAGPAGPYGAPAPTPAPLPDGTPPGPPPVMHATLSKWIVGEHAPGCCGPIGGSGPIGSEVYVRSGMAFPIGGGVLSGNLETGWDIEAGGRVLFFNRAVDEAWTVDLGIGNVFNPGNGHGPSATVFNVPGRLGINGQTMIINIPQITVTPANLNRTYVNLAGGHDWWLLGNANGGYLEPNWKFGVDVGGRYGSVKLDLQELQHFTNRMGGVFIGLHSELEVPCGHCVWQAGIRTEWGYTWTSVLQHQNNADLQDINLLFEAGVRF